jgi:aminopeptidase N
MDVVEPEAIHQAREALRKALGHKLLDQWRAQYQANAANRFELSPAAKGARRMRSVALGYIAVSGAPDAAAIAFRQFEDADNMTDRQGALGVLANGDSPERAKALAAFHSRYAHDALVIDKWFSTQALSLRDDTLDAVIALSTHPDFTVENPNRLRALVGGFAANQRAFHSGDGEGYRFLADVILRVDKLNPQSAARLVAPLGRWRRFGEARGKLMRAELERIAATPRLSKDVHEQVTKSLV